MPEAAKGLEGDNIEVTILDTSFLIEHGIITAIRSVDLPQMAQRDFKLNEYVKAANEPYMPA